jgi:threonine/homoserine/homoserine lactone efflux protein
VSVLHAAGLGLGLGVVTGIPLGVINVAIVDAATAGRRRFATGLGVGGGAADAIHALLAFTGVGRLVTADPALVRSLAIAAAIVIVAYAALTWRRRSAMAPRAPSPPLAPSSPKAPSPPAAPTPPSASDVHLTRGLATGVLLTLPNPGALAAWLAVAAAVWSDATPLEAVVIAAGVGVGSALWFALLAGWISRIRRDHPALAVIPRGALLLLVAIAVAGVIRAMTAAPA